MNESNFVNLTPHELNIYSEDESKMMYIIPQSGKISRVKTESIKVSTFGNIDIVRTEFGEVENLPEEVDIGKIYIVSRIVKSAIEKELFSKKFTEKFVVPDDMVRDKDGVILGCKRFSL